MLKLLLESYKKVKRGLVNIFVFSSNSVLFYSNLFPVKRFNKFYSNLNFKKESYEFNEYKILDIGISSVSESK